MKEFLVLIRGGHEQMTDLTVAQKEEHMQKWRTYMKALAQKGNLVGGLPLEDDGRVITKSRVSISVVLSESGEAVGGYLIFKAIDYNHAVELAKPCPIFEHNGNLEIREMTPMEM